MVDKPESLRIEDLIDFRDAMLTGPEKRRNRAAWKVLCRISDDLTFRKRIPEPTLEDLLKYEIVVHSNDSVHLSHTESPRCSVYDAIGVPTLTTIQNALMARIGRKLKVIDKRSERRKRGPRPL